MTAPRPDVLAVMQQLLRKYHGDVVVPLLARAAERDAQQQARIAELEAQVAAHTRRLERGHCGPYQRGALYETGDEVMWNGSTWRALMDDPPALTADGGGWVMVAQGRKYDSRGHKVAA